MCPAGRAEGKTNGKETHKPPALHQMPFVVHLKLAGFYARETGEDQPNCSLKFRDLRKWGYLPSLQQCHAHLESRCARFYRELQTAGNKANRRTMQGDNQIND